MSLMDLVENKNWETALITYKQENWEDNYTEKERTYRVSRENNYFREGKISNSLYGSCLDGKDNGVRLDYYNWKVEKIVIEK